jgi:probable HAF family extracellular repeat protein
MVLADGAGVLRCVKAAIATAVVVTALTLAGSMPAWAVEQPTASPAEASARTDKAASRKNKNEVGVRGHGFVRDGDVFTTIDAPGAGAFTVVFGIDENGTMVGGYVDRKGTLHGFLRDQDKFTVIDFPGARATFAARINAQGQIVGAYSEERNTPAFALSHGFLWQDGAFTPLDFPGARRTQPFSINNHGQIVGAYFDGVRYRGFLLSAGTFTRITPPGAFFFGSFATDIDDHGRIAGASL